jgi:NAD(P)-dependent dehydrogenase (short-subunit alcohol dehydrogenase family)
MGLLENKVAIITGSGSGIGKATALLFAKEGASIVVSDINDVDGQKVADEIVANGGKAIYVHANTAQADDNKQLVDEAVKAFGAVHIAVNNAGVGSAFHKLADVEISDWQRVIDINLTGVFYGMKYQIPAMAAAKGGSIINIASILGQVGFQGAAAYIAAKHGVVGLTKAGALDHAADNIRVNAIGPGFIYTGMVNENTLGKELLQALESKHALNRIGNAEEVAAMCLFLASSQSSFVTGAYYPVDGGYLAM